MVYAIPHETPMRHAFAGRESDTWKAYAGPAEEEKREILHAAILLDSSVVYAFRGLKAGLERTAGSTEADGGEAEPQELAEQSTDDEPEEEDCAVKPEVFGGGREGEVGSNGRAKDVRQAGQGESAEGDGTGSAAAALPE